MTEVSTASRVTLSEDVLFQELQGSAVLLDLKTGVYFGLDRVGTRIWQLLGERPNVAQDVEAMMSEFDVAAERCAADVIALVRQLEEQGLVAVTE